MSEGNQTQQEPQLLAVFNVQDQLTGYAQPVIKRINDRTTVAALMDWHQRNCLYPHNWKPSWFDVRITVETP